MLPLINPIDKENSTLLAILGEVIASVPDTARNLNIKPPHIIVESDWPHFDYDLFQPIVSCIGLLVSNFLLHGIESTTKRLRCGKPPIGTIKITIQVYQYQMIIQISDYGRGLDLKKLRKTDTMGDHALTVNSYDDLKYLAMRNVLIDTNDYWIAIELERSQEN